MNKKIKKSLHEILTTPISGSRPKGGVSSLGEVPSFGGENITDDNGINYYPIKKISTKFYENMNKGHLNDLDVIINKDGANTGKSTIYRSSPYLKAAINEHLFILRGIKSCIDQEYLNYLIQSSSFKNIFKTKITGSAQPGINSNFVRNFPIEIHANIKEQKKIALILNSTEDLIEKIQSEINKLLILKKSIMKDLFSYGINHKEFKNTELGKIPKEWNVYKFKEILKIVGNKVEMKDENDYKLISIKRRNEGVFERETLKGKDILTKSLSKVVIDTFVISKMQIVHGASGYIAEKFKDFYVSSSYLQFEAKDKKLLNTMFLFYYSQLKKSYKQFLKSSYGVHIEKMTFDLKSWYEEKIILPRIEEQKEIVEIIISIENNISDNIKKLKKYKCLKKSILEDLILGKKNINLN